MSEHNQGDTSYDFWVGKWVTSWKKGAGRTHRGTNVVLNLGGRIRELFEGPAQPGRYVGASLSAWNPGESLWEQEYWDNTGYHAFFRGGWTGDRFILDQVPDGSPNQALRRLVWHSVEATRMLWDYESSEDGGRTWTSTWHIAYRRAD